MAPGTAGAVSRSLGRYPDGADQDNLCADFVTQSATTLPIGSADGAANIKAASVAEFRAGQTILTDTGANQETAAIATIGTAGATTISAAVNPGATAIPVAGCGRDAEQSGRHDYGGNAAYLRPSGGSWVAGLGVTLTARLRREHPQGDAVARGRPTPGARNQDSRR